MLVSIILYFLNPLFDNIWIFDSLCKYMIYFSIGTYILDFINIRQFRYNSTIILPIICFLLVNIIYIAILYFDNNLLIYYFGFITSIVGSGFCFLLSYYCINKIKIIKEILCFWGKKSMEIYCVHLLILASIRISLLKIFNINELWCIVVLSGSMTLIICHMIFSKIFYEKTKLTILFGIKSK